VVGQAVADRPPVVLSSARTPTIVATEGTTNAIAVEMSVVTNATTVEMSVTTDATTVEMSATIDAMHATIFAGMRYVAIVPGT
jgi:hypothetical protein